ncbi:MAG: hypothetical protein HZB98_15565, partial [Bacteroidia bacterium]|nr:hypothetical protein [Bacteroidia bacterium]
SGFKWTYAITSRTDRIFPVENLKSYWSKESGTKHSIVPMPHYLFHNWNSFTDFISYVENITPVIFRKKSRKSKDL